MKKIRCAIYTRKSAEEGLEQEFNSLDAQREACAAYVASQKAEGWVIALDALEQALHERRLNPEDPLVHHSDRGVQYVSTRYTERLAEAGIEPSVGSRGDSYDNALAESIIGLYKTEVIHRRGTWSGPEDVEFATLEWVHWYNTQRLLEPIGNVAPVEYEMNYYRSQEGSLEMARLN